MEEVYVLASDSWFGLEVGSSFLMVCSEFLDEFGVFVGARDGGFMGIPRRCHRHCYCVDTAMRRQFNGLKSLAAMRRAFLRREVSPAIFGIPDD
jgi:hypothetical protein